MTASTTTSFDADFPYRLSEPELDRLTQASGLLSLLTSLSGQAALGHEHHSPFCNSLELHRALWAISDPINALVKSISNRTDA